MPKDNLPTYAIVELLIRLSNNYPDIGDYKNHSLHDEGVMVKTSNGVIDFPVSLVMQQFNDPELITNDMLDTAATSFKTK